MIPALAPCCAPLQSPPQDLSQRFEHPAGLSVGLWAESPLLFNPTAIDVDAQGRVWVAEGVLYRRFGGQAADPERPRGDRIVVLEDSDRDGAADRARVFVEDPELVAPLGVCVLGSRVFVSCSPHVLCYHDDDGDLVADRREVFLSGFGGFDHDHGVHSLVAGDDGWLYLAVGNAGPHLVTGADGFELRSGSSYTGGTPYNTVNTPGLASSDGRVWTGGLVLRVRPDGTGLSVVAHNFRNPYEVARDSLGNLFSADNDDDGNQSVRTVWVLEGANYGFASADGTRTWRFDQRPGQAREVAHWHADDPGVMPTWTINGAGGPTGVAVYECEFPDDEMAPFDGAVLNADAGAGVVWAHLPRRRGAGLELVRTTFLGRADEARDPDPRRTWFRPSDVAVAPDGSVLVADWYDPGVGGHGTGDRAAYGRILRVAPTGAPVGRAPHVYRDATSAEIAADERLSQPLSPLLNALASPAPHVRARAREVLLARGDAAYEPLHELAGDPSPRIAARAVELLARLSPRGARFVEEVTRHPLPELRVVAYRALLDVGDPSAATHRARLARDVSPFVRAAVALSLRDVPAEESLELLASLCLWYEGDDRVYLESLGLGATGKEEALFARALELSRAGLLDEARLREIAWRLHPSGSVATLSAWTLDPSLAREERRALLDALAFVPTRDAADAMFLASSVGPEDLRQHARWWLEQRATNDWRAFGIAARAAGALEDARELWRSELVRAGLVDVDVPLDGCDRVWLVVDDGGDGNSCDWADWIAPRFVLADGGEVPLASLAWLEAHAGWGETRSGRNAAGGPLRIGGDEFEEGIGTHAPARIAFEVPPGALRLVAQVGPDAGGTSQGCGSTLRFALHGRPAARGGERRALLERVRDGGAPLEERQAAARELAREAPGGLALVELARSGELDPEVSAAVAPPLLAHEDPTVRALAAAAFPPRAAAAPSAEELAALPGSAARGATLFFSERAQCSACHAVRGRGQDVGPDLTAIRSKYGRAELCQQLLDPSAAIAFGYESWVLRTVEGEVLAGFLIADGEDVVLRDTRGERHAVARDEIEALARQEISVMPGDVARRLEPGEVADLLSFLLADPAREPAFGPPIALFDGESLAGWTQPFADGSPQQAAVWSVADGVLRCAGTPVGYLRTVRDYRNFELSLEWRFDPARGPGNSGVLLRMVGPDKVWPKSIEAQLQAGQAGDIWNIDRFPMQVDAARSEGRRTAKLLPARERPLGEWNRYRILLDRGELTLEVNGAVQNRASWCEEVPGKICLQSEGAVIEFRNMVLREITN